MLLCSTSFSRRYTYSFYNKLYLLYLGNWQTKYSRYLDHQVVYGKLGIHPLFSHHFDLAMELQIRRCLSNPKVIAIGEIGLDYQT
jgi:Tat protein secretion system quality control protein TatD with DNase activity